MSVHEDGGRASAGASPPESLGRVGRYVLRAELASGGMATVYLAHLTGPHGFEKVVAVKRIHPHLVKDRRFVEMFLDEARVAGLLHHPNVCAISDFGEADGTPFLVMEYLHGESLATVMKVARTSDDAPIWLAARIVHDAARGLHAAHELTGPDGEPLGVVHRDVSPQNIFVLYDGLTKVVDFGVARARGRLSVTRTNEVKGKLPYMSPEQYENERVDRRTDVWALGVVLWEATTGHRLFRAQNDGATIARVLHKPIPRPSEVVPGYPAALEAIVMRCLERDVERRTKTAEALAEELEAFLYDLGKLAGASQVKKWMERHFEARIGDRDALLRGEAVPNLASALSESSTASSIRPRDEDVPTAIAPVASSPTTRRSFDEEAPTAIGPSRSRAPGAVDGNELPTGITRPLPHSPSQARARARRTRRSFLGLGGVTLVALAIALGVRSSPDAPAGSDAGVSRSAYPPAASAPSPTGEPARSGRETAPPVPVASEATPAPPAGEGEGSRTPERSRRDGRAMDAPPLARTVPTAEPRPAPPANVRAADADAHERAATAPVSPVRAVDAHEHAATAPVSPARAADADTHERAAAAPASPGRLNLIAIPPATARLGGRVLGETPLLGVPLPPGDHRLELRTEDGRSRTIVVHVESGALTRQRVDFGAR